MQQSKFKFVYMNLCESCSKVTSPFPFFLSSTYKVCMRTVMTAGGTRGIKWCKCEPNLKRKHQHVESWSTAATAAVWKKFSISLTAWTTMASHLSRSGSSAIYHPDTAPNCWRRSCRGHVLLRRNNCRSRLQLRWPTTERWVGDSQLLVAHQAKP